MTNIKFPFNNTLDLIFRQTDFSLQIMGLPAKPYSITLIGLLIILLLAIAATAITERLVGKKPSGGLLLGILFTIFGSALAATYINIPFDFMIEGVRVVAALLGAITIATFVTLIQGSMGGSGGGAKH